MRVSFRLPPTVFAALLLAAMPAFAQESADDASALSGTLKKIHDSGTLVIGYRESSLPFSFLNKRNQPIGYALDLCSEIADDVSLALDRQPIAITYKPVTSDNRIAMVTNGDVDIECGSTTSNFQRQKQVAFSPIYFIAGTKLLVPRNSPIQSYQDLAGKTVVVTAGTTNEAALRALSDKQKLGIRFVTEPDHAQSFALLSSGGADAFATDDILLYGLAATTAHGADYHVVGDYLSYDPYGLMFRRGDPAFAQVVDATFARLAQDRELTALYNKWFLARLPTGERLNVPMSPQLQEIFRVLGEPE